MHPGRCENKKSLQNNHLDTLSTFNLGCPPILKTTIYKIGVKEAPLTTILKTGVFKTKVQPYQGPWRCLRPIPSINAGFLKNRNLGRVVIKTYWHRLGVLAYKIAGTIYSTQTLLIWFEILHISKTFHDTSPPPKIIFSIFDCMILWGDDLSDLLWCRRSFLLPISLKFMMPFFFD